MSLFFKMMKSQTPEETVAMFFMYSKLGFTVLFCLVETSYALLYAAFCLVLWIAIRQPKYTGKSKMIKTVSPIHFYE